MAIMFSMVIELLNKHLNQEKLKHSKKCSASFGKLPAITSHPASAISRRFEYFGLLLIWSITFEQDFPSSCAKCTSK